MICFSMFHNASSVLISQHNQPATQFYWIMDLALTTQQVSNNLIQNIN